MQLPSLFNRKRFSEGCSETVLSDNRPPRKGSLTRRTVASIVSPFILSAFVLLLVFGTTPFSGHFSAYADGQPSILQPSLQSSGVPEIAYDGSVVAFYQQDLTSRMGMLSNPNDDVEMRYENGMVHLSWIPSNRTVYKGFYLDASISDEATWRDGSFIAALGSVGDFHYDITLPSDYCGYAWPVVPITTDERGGGTTQSQYYLAIPSADRFPGYYATVTFTDGMGGVLASSQVVSGHDAVPPAEPVRAGFVFAGWDAPYTDITADTVINAIWEAESGTTYTVTFLDGFGGTILSQLVREGDAAVAPPDPVRDGYMFTGWDPSEFHSVTSDLTVTAQWITYDQASLRKAREAIASLPSSPKTLLRETDNTAVADASAAYLALSDELKAQIPAVERMELARCAIAVLPSDPFKVVEDHRAAIANAQRIVESLDDDQQRELDSDESSKAISSSRSYGRYLENAVWALDGLKQVNNVSLLKTGTYTGQVASTSSMGKSNSPRSIAFTVKSITVKGGRATAVLEHGSNSSQLLRLGGVEYANLETDQTKKSYFEIPIQLNSTFHFSVKGKNATDDTDAITYEMATSADESSMTPDAADGQGGQSGQDGSSAGSSGDSGSPDSSSNGSSGNSAGGSSNNASGGSGSKGSNQSSSGSAGRGSGSGGSGANLNLMVASEGSKSSSDASRSEGSRAVRGEDGATVGKDGKGSGSTVRSTALGADSDAVFKSEDIAADGALNSADSGVVLWPAVIGCLILLLSAGALGFTLRFLKREGSHA